MTDTERLDWLERNLLAVNHGRHSSSVSMDGRDVAMHSLNEARGTGAGPERLRTRARTIREAIDDAADWT